MKRSCLDLCESGRLGERGEKRAAWKLRQLSLKDSRLPGSEFPSLPSLLETPV